MSWIRWFRRKQWDEERARELDAYLETETLDNIARGMPEDEARHAARRKLGNATLIREEIYRMNSIAIVETLSRDLRHAGRGLRKNPGFTLAVVAVLALGIGANTAIFSIVNTVLLRPLPFPEQERIVRVMHVPPQTLFPGMKVFAVSPANYLDWKSSSGAFESMAAYQVRSANLTGRDRPESVRVLNVAPEFFQVVQMAPAQGRTFGAGSDRPGSPLEVVVSHSFWVSHLASSPSVIGQTLTLDREQYTIVGVMPAAFELQAWYATSVQLWRNLIWNDADRAVRGNHNYMVVARLKQGVSVKAAGAELDTISARLEKQYPKDDAGWGATVQSLQETIVGDVRQTLWVLLGAVAFVLLIASANVANLILGRALGRRKEMAVRAALGATRGQILQHVLAESLLLSFAGGAAGLLLAYLAMPALRAMLEDQLPRSSEITLDSSVMMFTLVISVLTGLLAGAVPAMRASRVDLNDTLKQGGRSDARASGGRTRGILVVSEVALSFMLLIGAGLMLRSLWALRHVNPGIDPHNVATMSIFIPEKKYPATSQQTAFFAETLRRTRALPGIESAALVDNLPLQGGSMQPVTFEGRPSGAMAEQPEVATRRASPGYLTAMRIPLLVGRDFRENDGAAVLISESMAKQFWPNENPLGRHMKFTFTPEDNWEVIGVVGDVKVGGLTDSPRATVYQCSNRLRGPFMTLVSRTSGDPVAFVKSITDAIHEIDNEQPVQNVQTMDELIASTLTSERLSAILLGAFAGLAVVLAGVGIYGVLSYAVRSRTREIGIRTALGADVADIVRLVLMEGMKPALLGIAAGVIGAFSLTSVMTRLVYGVSPSDPATFAAVSVLFIAVSVVASTLPAYRASKVDPLKTLRDE
jgi:putative ABC transport system permease protein